MSLNPRASMEKRMAEVCPDARYAGGDVKAWQEMARAELARLVGYEGKKTSANYRVDWVREEEAFTETRFFYDTEPNVTGIGHILIPRTVTDKAPLIICLQGHTTGMHISTGHARFKGDEEDISSGDRDFARQIVARGQIALALEQRGFGERGGTEKGPDCTQPALQALLMGKTIIGQRCWDISRAIDVIEAQFPQADMSRIAVMGNSGGGTAAIYAAALDDRIAAAMPSCALAGFRASIGTIRHCICNYVPDIMNHFDMGDIVAIAAPKPYVVVNGQFDSIFPLDSANAQFEIAQNVYRLLGAEDKLRHVVGPEGHRFYASLGWPALDDVTGWMESRAD